MILVDTNVIIDFWNKPTDVKQKKVFEENDNGLVVPFQDAMVAYLAIKNNCEVWTNDKHFKLMQVVLPELKLFNS